MSLLDNFGVFSRAGKMKPDVCAGAVFRTRPRYGLIETAKVISVVPDFKGITHVSFEIRVEKSDLQRFDDRRMLNLSSFRERYPEYVQAA